ncbi:MAG TPA: twin-arginine translocase subunit TatC, partial [Candidatus Saccharimonadales bacterium]|nr:twin-arginine translocase subunit TatC [Candidatus Saccharimonadales bacterium]
MTLILASSASYAIKDQIMAVIMQPLGGQRLVYLTPIGGFNFIFKVSLYFGLAVILPVIIYHLYRFLEPLMNKQRKRSVAFFILASFALAIGGGAFASFAGLPAALHFLTGFTIENTLFPVLLLGDQLFARHQTIPF